MRTTKTYAEKLLDPRWQKKRLEVLNNANFQCEICGDKESTLHVHHKHYIKGREVWEYDNQQLISLCKECHKGQHDDDEKFHDLIARIPLDGPNNRNEVYYLIAGFIGQFMAFEHPYQEKIFDAGMAASDWWQK
ncbi:HNHc domain containing protein [uncultured Caudovirales phage]|uniref:HNHc domain containing protein n=1 Tax=uncultured Caudovirales phage TaxID=2100421 RepID=A0A6J7XLW5_9CAUD|nr:HNHc domain containing protein [uncultured Caudovirales phage]